MACDKRGLLLLNLFLLFAFACASTQKGKLATGGRRSKPVQKDPKEDSDQSKSGGRFLWLTSRSDDKPAEVESKKTKDADKSKKTNDSDKQKKGGFGWWLQPQKEEENQPSEKPSKQDLKKKEVEKKKQEEEEAEKKEKAKKEAQQESPSRPADSSPRTPPQQQASPQPPSTNGTTTTYMIMRPPYQQQQQPTYGTMGPQQGPPGGISANVVLVSHAATIVSNLIRFWLIRSITKRLGEEATVRPTQHFMWEVLNEYYSKDHRALQTVLSAAPPNMSHRRWRRLQRRQGGKNPQKPAYSVDDTYKKTVLVVDVKGSKEQAGSIDLPHLQKVVTFILTQHRQHVFGTTNNSDQPRELEVVLLVESPGGGVQHFGLAANQVERLSSEPGISTTVCVDIMAASGGYMIASQASQIIAAPFAMVGSVGVITQGLNWHDFLERYGIQPLVLKAGDCKVPLTTFGEVTKTDVRTAQRQLDKVHHAFKHSVVQARPKLEGTLQTVCNGEVFLASEALDLNLVDRVITSEDYILERISSGDRVLKLHHRSHHHARFAMNRFPQLEMLANRARAFRAFVGGFVSSGDAANMVSRAMHTTSMLGFAHYLFRNRLF